MVDANALIPQQGYFNDAEAPEILAAFKCKADEFQLLKIAVPGDFAEGWLDSTECCKIIAKTAGLARPNVCLTADDVRDRFSDAKWPEFDSLGFTEEPWKPSERTNYMISKAFVDLCLEHGLAIEFC